MKSRMSEYPTALSSPIDRTAKRVTSKGFSHEFARKEHGGFESDVPPPTIHWPSNIHNHLGETHDRITIVGFIAERTKPNRGHKMLGRCVCGTYIERNTVSWRKAKPPFTDCCVKCNVREQRIRHDKRRRYFEQHGVWPPENF